jgi:osmotically-inducible protein OsmY
MPELRRLVVTTNENEVVITGRVSSYYLKQLAQESLRGSVGVRKLLNRVEVRR